MLDSVRVRLTLWYTGVLALVLVAFALAAYFFLARTLDRRTDNSLKEMAHSFSALLAIEEQDVEAGGEIGVARDAEGNISPDAAVIGAVSEYRFRDYKFIVYDEARRVVAASPVFVTEGEEEINASVWTLPAVASDVGKLLDTVAALPDGTPRYTTLWGDDDHGFRAIAQRMRTSQRAYTLVVLRSLHEQEDLLEGASGALLVAVPLALLLASVGGYFLARKSLAPVVTMSDAAERISAANLHKRLPVANERDELGRLATVFNRLLARLGESFEQQRRFMADASHELRTPVAIVRGEAEVALSNELRPVEDLRESLAIVQDEGKRLTRIVEDLFTLARADAGQYRLTLTDFYLDELVGEAVRSVRTLISERDLSLNLNAPVEMPFRGDEALMRRLILNLLDNAIKHTPAGGSITVSCEPKENLYLLTVADTGSGIPKNAQPHIFERFYRADKARSRTEADGGNIMSGAGLGLSIARWIAEAHEGKLELQHSDRRGTVFVVTLLRLIRSDFE